MYGPIANLPGYNPNATYLPPGMAAPSSYPERTASTRKFYDMAPLPSVVDQSITDLAQGGLASSDYPAGGGISGGIGGNDGLEYRFLNDLIGYLKQPQTVAPNFSGPPDATVPPNFSGPSNDQYSGAPSAPRAGTVSAQEDGQWWAGSGQPQYQPAYYNPINAMRPVQTSVSAQEDGQPIYSSQPGYGQLPGYSQDYYQSQIPLQPFDIQPSGLTQSQLDQLGKLPSLPSQGSGSNWNTAMNLASLALPFPFGMAANALYGAAVGADGSHLTSDPSKGFLESMVSPSEPGLAAQAGNWLARQIAGEPKTQAELSAEQAYGSKSVYDPISGLTQMQAPTPSIAQGSQDLGGTFGNGEWAGPWYGDSNPYWLTGNMVDLAGWGPGTKYVMNSNDTN